LSFLAFAKFIEKGETEMRVDDSSYTNRTAETTTKPQVEPVQFRERSEPAFTSKANDNNFQANNLKFSLNKLADVPPTADPALPTGPSPYEALDKINKLSVPSLNDPAATRTYQQQRADLADAGLKTAVPPTRDDFKGLLPRLADMEYRDSLNSYNSTVKSLTDISTAANADLQTQPTAVLDDSAKRVWDAAQTDPQAGAAALAQEIDALNAKYGPEAGGQLVGKLYADSKDGNYDHNLNNILTFAGGDEAGGFGQVGLPEAQRNSIGTAIGQAYDAMSATDRTEFVNGLVAETEADAFRGNFLGGDATRVADLISRSDSAALKTDAVNALTKRMVEIEPKLLGNNGGTDIKALANSAAIIAGSGATGAEQAAMFNTIIKSFPEMDDEQLKSLMEDPTLKDNLSKVFINNSEAIIKGLTNEAGGMLDANSSDGLRQFFEMTMFSKNPGALREDVMGAAVKAISEFADPTALPTAGRTKDDDARTAGSLVGLVQAAALNKKGEIQDDQKSREETTQMFVGMAFAFAPGASDVLGEGAAKLLEVGYEKGIEYAEENAGSGLGGLINDLNDGDSLENIDEGFKAIRDLKFQVQNTLSAEKDKELYNAFTLGYSDTGVDQLFKNALGE
jgi:hypothetical protein